MDSESLPEERLPVSLGALGFFDYAFGVLPILGMLAMGGYAVLVGFALNVLLGLFCLLIFCFFAWLARALWLTTCRRRGRERLKAMRVSIVWRLCGLLVVLMLFGACGLVFQSLWISVAVIGPSYVAIRHVLLIYLDVQKERVHGGVYGGG